jgi:hypothetical protein
MLPKSRRREGWKEDRQQTGTERLSRDRLGSGTEMSNTGTHAQITDSLPQDLAGRFGQLVTALDGAIPAKQLDRNLILATWNLRSFGDLTEKSGDEGQPHGAAGDDAGAWGVLGLDRQ